MTEAVKKILAYQQTPLILCCEQTAQLPDDFLVSLTDDEKEYISSRSISSLEPIFFELLPRIGAAGMLSAAPPVLLDIHNKTARVFTSIDGISLPLAEEPSTQKWLVTEYVEPYKDELRRLYNKTKQRFGDAHIIHLSVLSRFIDGKAVEQDIVVFGEQVLDDGQYQPELFRETYEKLLITEYSHHTWIGIHPKLFSTHTLRKELLERLSRLKIGVVAAQ